MDAKPGYWYSGLAVMMIGGCISSLHIMIMAPVLMSIAIVLRLLQRSFLKFNTAWYGTSSARRGSVGSQR
jgi:hypothetical protein